MMEAIIVELVQELNDMNFELESDYARTDLVARSGGPRPLRKTEVGLHAYTSSHGSLPLN